MHKQAIALVFFIFSVIAFVGFHFAFADTVINGVTWGSTTVVDDPAAFCPSGSVVIKVRLVGSGPTLHISKWCQSISAPGMTFNDSNITVVDDPASFCPNGSFVVKLRIIGWNTPSAFIRKWCEPVSAPGLSWGSITTVDDPADTCPSGSALVKARILSSPPHMTKWCQSISVSVSSTPPTISGSPACTTGVPQSYTVTSVDSDSTAMIHYGFDWTGGTTPSEWAPPSGFVTQGTSETVSHIWSTNGTHTFAVEAVDSGNSASGWVTKTVTCTPAAICPDICPNGYQLQAGKCVFIGCNGPCS